MNRVRVVHVTEFEYDGPVSESYNEVHLQPQDDEWQNCVTFKLRTSPSSQPAAWRDYFGNWVHRFNVMPKHRRLRVEAESIIMVHEPPPVPDAGCLLADLVCEQTLLLDGHYDYLMPSTYVATGPELDPLLRAAEAESGGASLGFVHAATRLIHTRFKYAKGSTHVHSSLHDVLRTGAGVCQDFAHLLIGMARQRGLPARYVSGYLVPRGALEDGERKDETVIGGRASHAWAELFVPGVGWVAVDPTLGRATGAQHIRVASGRDYGDVPPVRGVYKGEAGQRLSVDVRVLPAAGDDGAEVMREAAPPPIVVAEDEPPQQPHQQQQQQQ
ncbi:MAG: transglutaminase family protein [bacterium]|nr:transglutaminase family protein [bacterium]